MLWNLLKNSRNSLDPYYLVPHYCLGHSPSLFGSRWVVGYQVVGVLRVPRKERAYRDCIGLGRVEGLGMLSRIMEAQRFMGLELHPTP